MGPAATRLRLASVSCLWAVFGFIPASASSPSVVWTPVALASAVGLTLLLLLAGDTPWASVVAAAVLLATNPALQSFWVRPGEDAAWDSITFLKTLLVIGGLLMLARLEEGPAGGEPPPPFDHGCRAAGPVPAASRQPGLLPSGRAAAADPGLLRGRTAAPRSLLSGSIDAD